MKKVTHKLYSLHINYLSLLLQIFTKKYLVFYSQLLSDIMNIINNFYYLISLIFRRIIMIVKTKNLVQAALLLAIAIAFQFVGKNFPNSQVFVGPAVNAVLILATFAAGTSYGIMVGILTPLLAFVLGQLNPILGPFVPFIMLGNALYVLCYGLLKNKGIIFNYLGFIVGSFVKFAFLYISSTKIIHLLHIGTSGKSSSVFGKLLLKTMTTPQLITALLGGFIAAVIITLLTKNKSLN